MSKMHHSDVAMDDAVLQKKEEKDVELDKKILALRKKNEALMRRYQEIEEDKKQAEREGMAVTSRKARPDGLTITITKPHHEKRIVNEKWGSSCSSASSFGVGSEEDDEESDHVFTFRMGKRVQLAVTMDNKGKGKRVVREKWGSEDPGNPAEAPDISEEEKDERLAFCRGRMQIAITMENKGRTDERKTTERKWSGEDNHPKTAHLRKERENSPQESPVEKNCPLAGRERSEYMQWKKERDQIDLERLTRHKNARGEWRRAWDVEKTKGMFEDIRDGKPVLDCPQNKKGGKNVWKSQLRALPSDGKSGGQRRKSSTESVSRTLLVASSKARGKDRLTGRARRWDVKEGDEMPFLKDELDNQQSINMEEQKNLTLVGEVEKEHHCLPSLENCIKLKESNVPMPQTKRSEMDPTSREAQSPNEKTGRGLTQDVSRDETEVNLKLNKAISGPDLSPKTNYKNSCQEISRVKASRNAIQEIHENFLDKNTCSERHPEQNSADNFNKLPDVMGIGTRGQELSIMSQTGEIHIGSLKKQVALGTEKINTACLANGEENKASVGEIQGKRNECAPEGTKMCNLKQENPESCNKEAHN
ncbi:coiled-coil domain-containing protein 9B isoform X1 [Pantherophis guttatus]|uniref:Coiled-coil domain-containing protein 9B isoform X1 n=2 Tax=Pantherophis guttatus TaxID=94885 RepID=A0A6P9C213_PANGU|nr:coiled-coil domain-containing protein 9B isoform X1 [Pantherophis guttatus]